MYRTLDYNGPFLTENVHNNNGLKLMYFALGGRYTHTPHLFYRQLSKLWAFVMLFLGYCQFISQTKCYARSVTLIHKGPWQLRISVLRFSLHFSQGSGVSNTKRYVNCSANKSLIKLESNLKSGINQLFVLQFLFSFL
jgi:hypothetical protein